MKVTLEIEYPFRKKAYNSEQDGFDVRTVEDAVCADKNFFGDWPARDIGDFVDWLETNRIPYTAMITVESMPEDWKQEGK